MIMKLIDALGNEYALPDGFGIAELAPPSFALSMQQVIGRHGASVEPGLGACAVRDISIQGKLYDKTLIEAGTLQAARADAMSDYYALMGWLFNAQQLGPVRIYRETDIIVDPAGVGYDAALAPLGYYLEGYLTSASAPTSWGTFGNAVLDVVLRFACPRPYWQGHNNATSEAGTVGDSTSITKAFAVLGSVPARPQFILYSAAGLAVETGKNITLTVGALSVAWNGTIPAASYLVFDCATGQVFTSAALPAAGRIDWDGASASNEASGLTDTADWAALQWAFATGAYSLAVSSNMVAAASLTAHIRFSNEYYG